MKNFFKSKVNTVVLAAAALVASGSAMAAGEATAAMTAISTEASALIADAWPIATTIVVAMISIKLFKKFANKAS